MARRPSRAPASSKVALAAAAAVAACVVSPVRGDGTFDGNQVSIPQIRDWTAAGPVPGLNWGLDTLPAPGADPLTFTTTGDGMVMLGGGFYSHPSLTFTAWTSYGLFGGGIDLMTAGGSTITVTQSVADTYGSAYFADGHNIGADLSFSTPTTINFTGPTTGALMLSGTITPGSAPLTLTRLAPPASSTRGVYFMTPNGGYGAPVTINTGTAARLIDFGRTGVGPINLNGGDVDILSEIPQLVPNPIFSSSGTVRADHNYTAFPLVPYAPGIVQAVGPITVDNPGFIGGTSDASIRFTANNGYNFEAPMLTLANGAGVAAVGTRTVIVDNGELNGGWVGSIRQTGPNRLQEQLVTTSIGAPGGFGSLMDFNIATGFGLPLIKEGTGVLVINGDNEITSTGPKMVGGGVLRFETALSYGTVTGVPGGAPVPVLLAGGPGPVSSAMGVGYPTPIPANLGTTGAIPGQSGAFDVDFVGNFAPVFQTVPGPAGPTALRLGSSGVGTQVGPVIAHFDAAFGTNTYYLGGGGGALTLFSPLPVGPGPGPTFVEMGTSGMLLPGRVDLMGPVGPGVAAVNIRAGTLAAFPPGIIGPGNGFTSLGAYSTGISTAVGYIGAPAITPYNGPGQLLLDDAVQVGPGYLYGPGGDFGAAGLMLDGGAIGWDGPVPLFAVPGAYGVPLASTLYQSAALPLAPVPTNVLHLGGENSAGAMTVFFPILDVPVAPVALMKSGVFSTLDLTPLPAHFYTGGTGIMGGEVLVSAGPQLGMGAVTIADGGVLHVVGPPGAAPMFDQILRAANGINRRASAVFVDPGVTATFTGLFNPTLAALEAAAPGSVLEVQGGGALNLYSLALTPAAVASPANTWGLKVSMGSTVSINHLPGNVTPANGQVLLAGGVVDLVSPFAPGGIPIPAATQYSPNYGFGALTSYAGTASTISQGAGSFFRITGGQTGAWMGDVTVLQEPMSVFKISSSPAGGATRGTGSMTFSGPGFVQFTPASPNAMLPLDGAFTLALNGTSFAANPMANINGNLLFNNLAPIGAGVSMIDGAVVTNAPASVASTWTVAGTGLTNWNGVVIKGETEAIPGGGGPFTTGSVSFNRMEGAPVIVSVGATLQVDEGVINAGGTGDPFTDSTTPAMRVDIVNNSDGPGIGAPPARGFNITLADKEVADLTVTGFAPLAPAVPTGATSVYSGATLTANHVRQNQLDINPAATVTIRADGTPTGTSYIDTLAISVGGTMDLVDNDMVTTAGTPFGTVMGNIISGRAGGAWTGTGINSSAAAANPATSLGLMTGADYIAVTGGLTVFSGMSIVAGDSLIKYTWYGDANFDGEVNFDDYALTDFGYTSGLSGWVNGDFDYNGVIDFDDFVLIDLGFSSQSGILRNALAYLSGEDRSQRMDDPALRMVADHFQQFGLEYAQAFLSAAPEPGSAVGLIGLMTAGALSRRRRHQHN